MISITILGKKTTDLEKLVTLKLYVDEKRKCHDSNANISVTYTQNITDNMRTFKAKESD